MRLWEELSGIIFKRIASQYLKTFREKSPEKILRKSLGMLDPEVQVTLKEYVRKSLSPPGGFMDRGGKPDIYYTLFGYYLAESLDLTDLFPSIRSFTENEISRNDLKGVPLHCAAILFSKLCNDKAVEKRLRGLIRVHLKRKDDKQPAYRAFISLLSCYYLNDFRSLYLIKKQLEKLNSSNQLPSPVVAALLVLQHSFGRNVEELKQILLSFFSNPMGGATFSQATTDPQGGAQETLQPENPGSFARVTPNPQGGAHQVPPGGFRGEQSGGFKAVKAAPVPDLLSTAVSLYALRFAGHDLRMIKPACLAFIDLLYNDGGFSANVVDPDPDIEYTFYGFLALGSLAD
ncbi:MAG: hypothetical protein ACM3UT_11925 [Chloroflexota bacterium]